MLDSRLADAHRHKSGVPMNWSNERSVDGRRSAWSSVGSVSAYSRDYKYVNLDVGRNESGRAGASGLRLPLRLHWRGAVGVAFVEVDLGFLWRERRGVAVALAVVAAEFEEGAGPDPVLDHLGHHLA